MSTNAEVVVYGTNIGIPEKVFFKLQPYIKAAERANLVKPSYAITNQDERDAATLDRATIKAGIKVLKDVAKSREWITDKQVLEAFALLESADERAKAEAKRLVGLLEGRVTIIDEAIKTWTRNEERRQAEEAAERRRQEAAAAEAAAKAAAESLDPDEEAPPPVQPVIPASEPVQRHSAVGAAKSTVKSSPVKCELWLDPAVDSINQRAHAVLEVAKRWPHALKLDEQVLKAEFAALMARGDVEKPSEAGTVIGGVRFYTELQVSG